MLSETYKNKMENESGECVKENNPTTETLTYFQQHNIWFIQFPVLTRLGSQLQTVIPIGIPALNSSDWDSTFRQLPRLGSQCPIFIPFHLDWNPGFRQLSRMGSQFQIFIPNGIPPPDAYPGLSRQFHRDCIGIPMDPVFVFSWVYSLNMQLHEVYGMSESTGPHTVGCNEDFKICSVGHNFPGSETKLANPDEDGNGEICMWGRHVFMGYLNAPEKNNEIFDEENWLKTGDLGKHDAQGFLFITGRIKELIITAGGENIAPVPMEDAVKEALPCINNCMLIGDKRKFLSMILCLKVDVDTDTAEPSNNLTTDCKEWCKSIGSQATTVEDIIDKKDAVVLKAIQDGIDRANAKSVSRAAKVQKWSIIPRDFSIPGGELGPTLKLRRPVVTKMYKKTIDAFYTEAEEK